MVSKTNSTTNPGRVRITLATLTVLAMSAAILLLGGTTAQAQNDQGALPNLRLSSASPGTLTISWDAPDPAPSDYRVIWAREDLGFLSYKNSNEANRGNEHPRGSARSITLTGLTGGEIFKVRARTRYTSGGNNNGPWSGPWTDTVAARVKNDPPVAPSGLTAGQVSHDSVTLTWTAPGSGSTVTGYRVLRGPDASNLSTIARDTGSVGTEYTDNTVAAETTYQYAVLALSQDGDGAQSATTSATTPAAPQPVPTTPTGLIATPSHDQVSLSWDDPQNSSITGYQIWRGPDANSLASIQADTGSTTTTYVDDTVTAETVYHYAVSAINQTGTGDRSGAVSTTTPAAPQPPAAPTGLQTSGVTHNSIILSWTDPEDTSITGYRVLRGTEAGKLTAIADDTGSNNVEYTDSTVTAETTYHYAVLAHSQDGNGVQSTTVSTTTPAEPRQQQENTNSVPTASNGTVATDEDTDHAFSASEFNYSDSDSDTLASVKITELPAADRGTLALDGTAINSADLPKTITKAELDDGKLKYSPPADANGTGYASFRFRVNDGTQDSASQYTLTISVTAVNDPATGAPAISGDAEVGETLTASTGSITDPDGLPSSFTHQWKRFAADGTTFEENIGTDSDTYTLTESELGKKVKVEVSFTDNEGSSEGPLVSAAYPSDATVEAPEEEVSSPGISIVMEAPSRTTVGSAGTVSADIVGFDVFPDPDGHEYTYRIDVLDSDGNDADVCEGDGMGEALRIFKNKTAWVFVRRGATELREAQISDQCEIGAYTARASVSNSDSALVVSAEAEFEITAQPPAAPTGLTTQGVTHNSITLSWTDPEDASITGYRVLRGNEASKLTAIADDTDSDSVEYTDSTVAAEIAYFYAVLALSQDRDGAQSAALSVTTPAEPSENKDDPKPTAVPNRVTRADPTVPLNLAVVPADAQLTFTWDPPTNTGGSPIIRYNYAFGPSGGTQADGNHGTAPTGSQTLTKTGLTNGTAYTFKVRAITNFGGSITVGPYTAVVTGTPNGPITLVSNASEASIDRGSFHFLAQSFGTGSHSTGYTVSEVQIYLTTVSGRSTNVKIREDNSGAPGDEVALLMNPGTFTANAFNTFTAPADTVLRGSRTYWLSVNEGISFTSRMSYGSTRGTGQTGATGWTIADGRRYRNSETASWTTDSVSLRITVKGTANPPDTTAPAFASAAANGTSLVITFDEDLAAAASLANGAFTVKKTPSGGSEATVTLSATAPVISGKTVTLTLATALVSTDGSVKVSYTKPTSGSNNKLVDAAANETADFTDQTVTNNTPVPDTTPPTLVSATVNAAGTSIVLKLSEDLNRSYTLPSFTFNVTADGITNRVSAVTFPTPLDEVSLTVSSVIHMGQAVVVVYTDLHPADDNVSVIEDVTGNDASSFTTGMNSVPAVTNSSTVADTTAPVFASAAADGTSLVITFTENLAAAASLANSAFTVKKTPSGSSEATVTLSATAPVISGKTVTLTLATALVSTDTAVKVSYTKPATGSNNKLVDAAANETGTFPDRTVTNNTPAPLPVITIAAGASGIASVNPLEGDRAWFTLSRTGSTTAALTVNVTVSETGGDRVEAANEGARTEAFQAGQSTRAPIVPTVDDDVDQANSTVTMTVRADTADPAAYTVGTPASATVTVQDDDARGVTVSAATLTVNEGSTGTYTVELDSQPTAPVTVTPSKTGSSDVTFAPASLTFTKFNWHATQTVTVSAADDSDAVDDSATISHAVTGGDYGSETAASVVVTVDDDETVDATAPAFASATASGTSLVIIFDEDLAAATSLANSAFTVKKTPLNGTEATVTLSTTVGPVISGKTVTLTLGTALASTDGSIKVSYTKPTTGSNNKLVDAAANETGTFTDQTVIHNAPPLAPARPIVAPVPRTTDSLTVNWTAPENTGRPAITSYDVRYRPFEGTWINGPQDVSGGPVTLAGLPLGSAFGLYQVQVRATNTAGDGPWSESAREILFPPEEEAAADYGLVPAGVRNGDSFRLLFITHATTTAESDQGFSFDESVVKAVVDSQGRWPFFRQSEGVVSSQRALLSTPGVDARVRTDTTFTAGDKGVPIYWLRGAKVADDYEDFYDGDWDDEASPTDSTAKVVTVTTQPWTGSSNDGTELFAGTVSLALGRTRVGIAGLDSTTVGHGPLSGGDIAATGMLRPLFGLSQVYVVRDNLLASNMAQTGGSTDKRSARRSQRFTTGSNPGGYSLDSVTFSAHSASDTTAITYTNWSVSVYTVDAMGHPATEHAALAAPEPHIVGGNVFTAPAETTLSADTTYAVVVTAGTTISTVGFGLTTTDLKLEVTTSNGENERSASDWSIFDAFDIESSSSWSADTGSKALYIAVRGAPRPVPGKPTGLSATPSGGNQIDLSWTTPDSNGGSAITGYRIEVSTDDATWTDLVADTSSTTTTYSHTGLSVGDTRHYRVSAINVNGTGPASDIAMATIPSTATGVPAITAANAFRVPGLLTANKGTITDTDGVPDESTFTWQWVQVDGMSETDIISATSQTYTLAAADAGKTIKVKASFTDTASNSEGPLTSAATSTILAAATCAVPTSYPGGATQIWTGKVTVGQVKVGNDPLAIRGYLSQSTNLGIVIIPATDAAGTLSNTAFAAGSQYTIKLAGTQIANNTLLFATTPAMTAADRKQLTLYVCDEAFPFSEVRSSNEVWFWSNSGLDWRDKVERTLYITRDQTAPTVASVSFTGTTLTLTFNEDLGPAASLANSAFTVNKTPSGGVETTVTLSGTPTISGKTVVLTLATALVSTDGVTVTYTKPTTGTSNKLVDKFGNEMATFTKSTTGTVPGAPTNLTATAISDSAINLSWTAPANNGGSAITGYKIERRLHRSDWTTPVANTGSTATTYSSTGLFRESNYSHRVSAINTVGTGAVSNTAGALTFLSGSSTPTSSNSTVTTTEDTDYTFTTADFPVSDADGDLLSYVIITTLPEAGKGSIYRELLQISQLPVQTSEGRISQGHLRYVPPADGNGPAYASFKFKVEDTGRATSASEYTMTINVTPVNDAATGTPTITGSSKVGNTLTASTSDIIDVEGLPGSFTYQWKRFTADGTTFEANIGTNSSTYMLTDNEEGKKVKVEVSFTDNGGTREGPLVSSAFPSSGTVTVPTSDSLNVGPLAAYWNDNHDQGGNALELDSCTGVKGFQVIWDGPDGNRRADEWTAEITAKGGASTVSQNFRETPGNPGYFELDGRMLLAGPDTISIRVRGRFGATWGTWSPTATLHCFENERE